MAVGMTLVLIICQIDLSVGFAAGFLGACAARLMAVGVPLPLVILIVLGMGALIGLLAGYKGISWTIIIVVAVVAIYDFILQKTRTGRHIYGMGGNIEAALLSGVNVKRTLIGVFASMGCMAALGGILYSSRIGSATPTAGMGFELDAIASCYIAGVSATGGIGNVINSVVGAFVIMSLTNGLNLIGVGISYQYLIKGIIFVCAVALDVRGRGKKAIG